jgi:hypothetical protein
MRYSVANLISNLRQLGVMVPCTVDLVKAQAMRFQLEMLTIQKDLTEVIHAYDEPLYPLQKPQYASMQKIRSTAEFILLHHESPLVNSSYF